MDACFEIKRKITMISNTNGRTWSFPDLEEVNYLYEKYKKVYLFDENVL